MPSVQFLIPLLPSELHMASVLHYHNVSQVPLRLVGRLVLSLQNCKHAGMPGCCTRSVTSCRTESCACTCKIADSWLASRPTTCSLASTRRRRRPAVLMPCTAEDGTSLLISELSCSRAPGLASVDIPHNALQMRRAHFQQS